MDPEQTEVCLVSYCKCLAFAAGMASVAAFVAAYTAEASSFQVFVAGPCFFDSLLKQTLPLEPSPQKTF